MFSSFYQTLNLQNTKIPKSLQAEARYVWQQTTVKTANKCKQLLQKHLTKE